MMELMVYVLVGLLPFLALLLLVSMAIESRKALLAMVGFLVGCGLTGWAMNLLIGFV